MTSEVGKGQKTWQKLWPQWPLRSGEAIFENVIKKEFKKMKISLIRVTLVTSNDDVRGHKIATSVASEVGWGRLLKMHSWHFLKVQNNF